MKSNYIPKPGQIWSKKISGINFELIVLNMDKNASSFFKDMYKIANYQGYQFYWTKREWKNWACPWWKRKKHWAKCIKE